MALLAFVVLFGVILYVGGKIGRLENRIAQLERENQESVSPQVHETFVDANAQQASQQLGSIPPPPTQGDAVIPPLQHQVLVSQHPNHFVEWIQEDFMVKLGAFLLLLALGWFVSYAFANDWIGPFGRIALGLILGAAFLAAGVWRIKKYIHQGGIFTVLGATTILLTVFSARELYNFFTPSSALLLMFSTVVFVAFVSVRYNSQALAHGGLILGSIAPLFTNVPAPDVVGLFSYLLLVSLGTLWVVWRTGWCMLTFISMSIAFLYSLPFLVDGVGAGSQDVALLFAFIFVGMFFIANIISIIFRTDESYRQVHILTALGTGVYLLTWVYVAASPQWQSLLYVAWALVFMIGSYIVYTLTVDRVSFYLYGSTSIALIGAATAAELGGAVLTIAYTFEVALLLMVATALRASSQSLSRLSMLFIVPVLLSLDSFVSSSWRDGVMHSDFVVLLLIACVLLAVGLFVNARRQTSDNDSVLVAVQLLLVASAVYWVSLIWLVAHAMFMSDTLATTLSLVVYTISGITMFISGKVNSNNALRIGGAVLIGLVIIRLLFIEVWDMSIGGRIIAFFVVGLLLISTAFLQRGAKKEEVIETNFQ